MTKVFMTALAVIGFSINGMAQDKGTIELGANLGFNFSSVRYEGSNTGGHTAINAGLSGEYFFSDRWGIKAKLLYDRKGWDEGYIIFDDGTNIKHTTDFSLDYITIPVTASWHFGGKRNWYLHAGPYVGFLMSAKESKFGTDVKEYFNTTDFGIALGIGYKVRVSDNLKLFIEYDEQTGIADIAKNNDGSSFRNSRGSFNVGATIILK